MEAAAEEAMAVGEAEVAGLAAQGGVGPAGEVTAVQMAVGRVRKEGCRAVEVQVVVVMAEEGKVAAALAGE